MDTMASGAANGTQDASRLATPLRALSTAIDGKLAGKARGSRGSACSPTPRARWPRPRAVC
jgi:hypothetical protein